MARNTTKLNAAREAINDERMTGEELEAALAAAFSSISFKKIAAHIVIGAAWGYTLGCVAGSIIDAVMLLSIPTFVAYAMSIGVLLVAVYAVLVTGPVVAEATYDAAAFAAKYIAEGSVISYNFAKSKLAAAKEWINEKTIYSRETKTWFGSPIIMTGSAPTSH